MKKKGIGFLLAFVLLAALALPAAAEEFTGSDHWTVQFSGSAMESNFKTSQMDEAVSSLQPGDSVQFQLSLQNDSTETTDWYMTNKVLASLEDSQSVAGGGAYTYELLYTDAAGKKYVLYSSDAVGGEKSTAAGKGLHEATESLKEYFFLDELLPGQAGAVELTVALEGETQGNAYQDTLAALQMNFAVELVPTATTPNPPKPLEPEPTPTLGPGETPAPTEEPTPTPTEPPVYTGGGSPKTGDPVRQTNTAILCGEAALFFWILASWKRHEDKKQ